MCRILLLLLGLFTSRDLFSQTLGGTSLFNFVKFPSSPQVTALGGINCSQLTKDVGLSFYNPALMRPSHSGQAQFAFNSMVAGVQSFQTTGAYYQKRLATSFGLGIHYFNYGQNDQTDASGNIIGRFHAADYVVQAMVSRSYLQRWNYGVTLKWLQSSYGIYRASAIALDAGVTYTDSLQGWRIGLVASNMGSVLSNYASGSKNGDLPFDLRVGLSRKLPKAPIQLSVTLHHLHRFDLTYDDTSSTRLQQSPKGWPETIFRHVVIGAQIFITERIEFSAGYNYLRRKELTIANNANGLNGFSMGVGVLLKRLQFRYARTYYQSRNSSNQIGLSLQFSS